MELPRRELLIARIVSGTVRCHIKDQRGRPLTVTAVPATREQRYISHEVYEEVFRESEFEGLFTENELLDFLLREGLWDNDKQALLEGVEKDIENLKVKMYEFVFRSAELKQAKKMLATAKAKLLELMVERHAYDHTTCQAAANLARNRYLVGVCLHYPDGNRVAAGDDFWRSRGFVLDEAIECYVKSRLDESCYRELSRTDPWRNIWAGKKGEGSVFGVPAVDLTDEQKNLQVWSMLYENIVEHPDCPPEDVLNDDDVLDGWLILQRRNRLKSLTQKRADEVVQNEKIRNSDEVFIVADTADDARKIEDLNDQQATMLKKQRLSHLEKHGEVPEEHMPDTKRKLQMELNRMATAKAKG